MAAARDGDDASSPADDDSSARDPIEVLFEEYFDERRRGDSGVSSDVETFARRLPGREAEFRELVAALGVLESAATTTRKTAATATIPERLGRFRLLSAIGRGGMGAVFEAEDEELGRRVALKLLPGYATLDEREVARFRREAQSAARLNHPHIVPVFGVGEEDGTHWIAMQLISGSSLADAAGGTRRMAPRDVARHGLALADALAYAHAEGILHRDVKPSNVLLDRSDTVWITDFGLATSAGAAAITRTGETVGSPRYMAPEAFSGWADPRTDVWGVGVTLYELLAGRPAFDGTDRAQLLKQITDVEPKALRDVDPSLPRDLATIVHQCLQKEPGARYATAKELADDLRRFLDGASIRARPPSVVDRVAFLVRRHRGGAIAAGVAFLALVAILAAWAETLRRKNERLAQWTTRAEENLAIANDAIERVLYEATADTVFRAPALDPMRRRVLEAALEFELRLLENQEKSDEKSLDVARAQVRVGNVEWALRRLDESRAHHEAAVLRLRGLAGAGEDGAAVANQLASALTGLACVARDRGDLASAEASLREAIAVLENATGNEPKCVDGAHHLASAAGLLADVLSRQRRARDGATSLRATLPRVDPWLDRDDAPIAATRVLRDAYVLLAEAEEQTGDMASAVATLRRAIAVSGHLVDEYGGDVGDGGHDPDVRDLAFDASRRSWLGALLHRLGESQEASTLVTKAREELETIAGQWPMVPEFRRDLSDALARESNVSPASEPMSQVEQRLLRAIELADGCLAERPDDASFALPAMNARNTLTTMRADAGDHDGALAIAVATTNLVEARGAAVSTWPAAALGEAAVAWYDRGVVENDLGRIDEARASFARANALAELPSDGFGVRTLRLRLGVTRGSLLAWNGELEAGLSAWSQVQEDARAWLAEPEVPEQGAAHDARDAVRADVTAILVQALNLDVNARMRHGDRPGAATRLKEAQELAEELVAEWPERSDFEAALGMVHGDAGTLAAFESEHARARAEFVASVSILHRAVEREPRQIGWRRSLAFSMDGLAGSLEQPASAKDRDALASWLEKVASAADAATTDPSVQVEAARVFARAATVKYSGLGAMFGAPARDAWADTAMQRLLAAGAAGFSDVGRFDRDIAFDSLKGRDDFRRWLADLKATSR